MPDVGEEARGADPTDSSGQPRRLRRTGGARRCTNMASSSGDVSSVLGIRDQHTVLNLDWILDYERPIDASSSSHRLPGAPAMGVSHWHTISILLRSHQALTVERDRSRCSRS
jgi:hypothetical protein